MQPYREQAYDTLNVLEEDLQLACAFIHKNVRPGLLTNTQELLGEAIKSMAHYLKWEYRNDEAANLDILYEYIEEHLADGNAEGVEEGFELSFAPVKSALNEKAQYGGVREYEKD